MRISKVLVSWTTLNLSASCVLAFFLSASALSSQESPSEAPEDATVSTVIEEDVALPESDEENAESGFNPGGTVTVLTHAGPDTYPSVVKIVPGGFRFRPGNADWQGEGGCTGVLIRERVVLTAQHCIFEQVPVAGEARPHAQVALRFRAMGPVGVHSQTLRVSRSNVALMAGAIRRDASGRIVLSPDGTIAWEGCCDLALLRLDEPVPRADLRVARVASNADLARYTDLILIGYGLQLMNFDGRPVGPRRLGFLYGPDVNLRFVEGSAGTQRFGLQSTIIIRGQQVSAGLCNGDSGGPVFMARFGASSDIIVVGINHAVSIGGTASACAQPGVVSYVTSVLASRNRAFIAQGLAKFGLS